MQAEIGNVTNVGRWTRRRGDGGRKEGGEGERDTRRGVEAARANLKAQLHEDKRFGKYPFFFARPERVRLRYRISALRAWTNGAIQICRSDSIKEKRSTSLPSLPLPSLSLSLVLSPRVSMDLRAGYTLPEIRIRELFPDESR